MQKYALVIARNQEETVKKYAGRLHGLKAADWLYDGLHYKEGATREDLKAAVSSHESFFPSVVIDGGAFLSSEKFSPAAWKANVLKFIDLTSDIADISFYTFDAKK